MSLQLAHILMTVILATVIGVVDGPLRTIKSPQGYFERLLAAYRFKVVRTVIANDLARVLIADQRQAHEPLADLQISKVRVPDLIHRNGFAILH